MGVVDEPVEDGVGVGGVPDEGVPVGDGDLAGDEGRGTPPVTAALRGRGEAGMLRS